ncbi:MAG TPA: hypothetical protein VG458_07820, partial [Solirubrobacterales bacterium]|nr:hypothetical protein [Solirubrobacterales bacterium]
MRARTAIAALAVLAAALPASVAVGANDRYAPQVADLRVVGDDGTWTAETSFRLRWTVRSEESDVTGVGIRLRGAALEGVTPYIEIPAEAGEMTREVEIPAAPGEDRPAAGTYTVEVWAKSESDDGPPQRATLRVDNQRPGPATPQLDAAWFRGDVAPLLRIAHPAGPLPVSGIRGYAISLRRDSAAPPCAGPDRCSAQETDLAAGIDDDEVSLGLLPEGIHVASVVAVSK